MSPSYTAVIHPAEEGGFWGYVLEVPGVNSQGETEAELVENLKDALALMLECLKEQAEQDLQTTGGRRATFEMAS